MRKKAKIRFSLTMSMTDENICVVFLETVRTTTISINATIVLCHHPSSLIVKSSHLLPRCIKHFSLIVSLTNWRSDEGFLPHYFHQSSEGSTTTHLLAPEIVRNRRFFCFGFISIYGRR